MDRRIKQGRTIYLVMVFPDRDPEFAKNNSSIKKMLVMSRPYSVKNEIQDTQAFDVLHQPTNDFPYPKIPTRKKEYMATWQFLPNNYNMHRAFFSRRQAQAYFDRMMARRLSAAERERIEGLIRPDLNFPVFLECEDEEPVYLHSRFFDLVVRKDPSVIRINTV